jgi:predicted DNA-binding helix-hairpin-helix protein
MVIRSLPDPVEKLALLGDAARYEPAGDRPEAERIRQRPAAGHDLSALRDCITEVTTPTGKKPVLKAMSTTACEKNCFYCPFRAGRDQMPRVTFTPDEIALAFNRLQVAGIVDGIFLSSGVIRGGVTTQDAIIDAAEIIRRRHRYTGYVHLKIMPGAERDQILRAMQLADRVSVNLEAPTPERLQALAPRKDFDGELLSRLRWADEIRRQANAEAPGAVRASLVTQFVVGAVGDTDLELLNLSAYLHRQVGLKRAYYSRFNPVSNTPLEHLLPTAPEREHRLYQASFLIRDYAWDVEELPFTGDGNLRLDVDPKKAWADEHLREHPLDVMTAPREALLRVPGFGPKAADAIVRARRRGRLSDVAHLRALGIRTVERAEPYILLDGRRPPHQLTLFG